MCRRAGVRYSQILVWNTDHHVGNAAVMGVLPWLRYVLLSDVLLERMNDQEIEAVFAHELGHVVHRHMTWYAIFFIALTLVGGGLYLMVYPHLRTLGDTTAAAIPVTFGMLAFFLLFGALSRRCERQADVYAARTMELLKSEESLETSQGLLNFRQLATVGAGPLVPPESAHNTPVGRHGAWLFAAALRRVAVINNIPITPRKRPLPGVWNHLAHWADNTVEMCNNWQHGSIANRMQYLQDLSVDPRLTTHFDRTMFWIFWSLLFALFTSVTFSILQTVM